MRLLPQRSLLPPQAPISSLCVAAPGSQVSCGSQPHQLACIGQRPFGLRADLRPANIWLSVDVDVGCSCPPALLHRGWQLSLLDDKLAEERGIEGSGARERKVGSLEECVLTALAWESLGGCRFLSCTWPWLICWHITWSLFFSESTEYSFRGLGSSLMGAGDKMHRCGAWQLG